MASGNRNTEQDEPRTAEKSDDEVEEDDEEVQKLPKAPPGALKTGPRKNKTNRDDQTQALFDEVLEGMRERELVIDESAGRLDVDQEEGESSEQAIATTDTNKTEVVPVPESLLGESGEDKSQELETAFETLVVEGSQSKEAEDQDEEGLSKLVPNDNDQYRLYHSRQHQPAPDPDAKTEESTEISQVSGDAKAKARRRQGGRMKKALTQEEQLEAIKMQARNLFSKKQGSNGRTGRSAGQQAGGKKKSVTANNKNKYRRGQPMGKKKKEARNEIREFKKGGYM